MQVITQILFTIFSVAAANGHPPYRGGMGIPNFNMGPNTNRFQTQDYMSPDMHRGLIEEFFHSLFGNPQSYGQNDQGQQNTFDHNIFGNPGAVAPEVTQPPITEEPHQLITQDLHPHLNDGHQDLVDNINTDGPQNVPDIIHNTNLPNLENILPKDVSAEDVRVRPVQNHVNEQNPSAINQNVSPVIPDDVQNESNEKSPLDSEQLKLSKVIPSDANGKSSVKTNNLQRESVNENSSSINGKNKDKGLSKESDFLLIPVTNTDSQIVFPDSTLSGLSNIAQESFPVAVNPVSAVLPNSAAATIQIPAPITSADTPVLSTGNVQVPITQPAYQFVNTMPKNQGNVMPFSVPATSNSQPAYTILNIPNNSGYQNNQQPIYIMTNNAGSNGQLFALVPINQPNNLIPVNNHPNLAVPNSQLTYVTLNNPDNSILPQNNQNIPVTNPGVQYVIIGSQPNNAVSVNQPNNVPAVNNQPQNLVPLNSQPVYVTLGNQPNTYVPVDNHVNNVVSPNPSTTFVPQTNDASNLVSFSNPDYNVVPVNTAPLVQTPIVLQPLDTGSVSIIIAMKDEANNGKKDKLNENHDTNASGTDRDSDINKASVISNLDAIHFPDELDNDAGNRAPANLKVNDTNN